MVFAVLKQNYFAISTHAMIDFMASNTACTVFHPKDCLDGAVYTSGMDVDMV